MNCFFYFVVLCLVGIGVAHIGVWLAAGQLIDKQDRLWGRRKNSLHPEGPWLQGSCGDQGCVPLIARLWGMKRIFPKLAKSSRLYRAYTCTRLHTYQLWPTLLPLSNGTFPAFIEHSKLSRLLLLPLPSPLPLGLKSFPSRSTLFEAKLESIFFG